MNPAYSGFINQYTSNLGLAPMQAYNKTIGWDTNKNGLDQTYNSPLRAQYDNYINTVVHPDYEKNTYAPAVNNFGYESAGNNGNMLGMGQNQFNTLDTGLQRQYAGNLGDLYNQYNNFGNQTYQNGLQSYMINNPNAFSNRDPHADLSTPNSMPNPIPTPNPQASQPVQQSPGSWNPYQVQSGNTLGGIYQNKGYSGHMGYNDFLNKVVTQNHLRNANSINSGATLQLPTF